MENNLNIYIYNWITLLYTWSYQNIVNQLWSEVKWSRSVVSDSLWPRELYNPPGSSVHGILQIRILEWAAISSSRRSSWPKDQTLVSSIVGRFFTIWATREAAYNMGAPKYTKQVLIDLEGK